MSVVTVPVTTQVPKEGKEIADAVHVLVKHFVNGGNVAGAALHLQKIFVAVDGAAKVVEEMKSVYNDELTGYFVQRFWDSLKKDVPVEGK